MTTSLAPLDVVGEIAARASPLWDRVGDVRVARPLDADRVARALDEWRGLIAAGDDERFARRLDWDGLTPDTVAALMDGASTADADAPWADALRAAYGVTTESVQAAFDNADPSRVLDPSDPLPFEELFVPLVEYARRRLAAAAPVAMLSAAIQRNLERTLLARLTRLGLRALYSSFSVSRAVAQDAGILALAGALQEPPPRILYDAFLTKLQRGRILAFFRDYSVLARLYGTTTALWIDATAEFVRRLADDMPAIAATFAGNAPLGDVAEIQGGLSDSHEGGRSVLIVRFASGVRVVYKPRPLDVEQQFGEMLHWLGTRGSSTQLRHPAVLGRPTHGWLEFIETGPCQDRDAVARYYRRCGMLLAMTYALNGTDFHYENLLAAGEDPVLIDLEMLLSHHFELVEELPAQELGAVDVARHAFERSVLKVALLPILKVGNQGEAFDMGGIGGAADTGVDVVVVRLASVNTDGMRQVKRAVRLEAQGRNLPVLDGAPVDALPFVEEIVGGFNDVYRILMRDRETVLAPGGPLDRMRHARIRFIFRHTSLYASLLERVLHPTYLRDGVARSVQLDVLTRPLLGLDAPPALWPLIAAERAALEQLDIPYFATSADERTLTLPTGVVIQNCFQHSPHEEATKRLQTLDEADLAAQIDLIRASFAASAARDVRRTDVVIATDFRSDAPANAFSDDGALRGAVFDEAARIVEMIRARGIPTPDGARTWIAPAYVPRARRYRVAPMSSSVFDGYGGLAIFFAALSRHIEAGLADEAVRLLQPLRSGAADIERFLRFHARADIGIGAGLTSGIYALVRVANAVGEPALLRDASGIAGLLTDDVIARDEAYGVMAGAAGAILSLLALADASSDDAALDRARQCADHLLNHRVIDAQTKSRVWLTRYGQTETGFAHGLAGIAYALQRLGRRVADTQYLDAAAEAIAHERFMIGAAGEGADADERSSPWGRGRTGIALARLAGGVVLDAHTLAETRAAVAWARGNLVADSDDLCCGSAGRWELLLTASDALSKPSLAADARDSVQRVVSRLRSDGTYRTASELGSSEIGLFRGAPGTIYQMLRVLDPATVPSLLTWH